jgi:hypothetical protein
MVDPILVDRFKAKYALNRQTGCWDWTASTAGKGYGQIKLPGTRRQIYAHHLSWQIHHGKIPTGKYILHRCDNPRCVNPDHLFVGSAKVNAEDMKAKDRHLRGELNTEAILTEADIRAIRMLWKAKDRHLRGELNTEAILTEADIRAIRMLCAAGDLPQRRIAQLFGIQQMEVSRIHRRERWAHVKDSPIG